MAISYAYQWQRDAPNQSWLTTPSYGVAVDANYIYWTNSAGGKIGRADLNGGNLNASFITGLTNPMGIAVNGSYIYWSNFTATSSTISRANLDGTGASSTFITGLVYPAGIALDATYIYWASYSANIIYRAALAGTGQTSLVTGLTEALDVAVDSTYIYWTNNTKIGRAVLAGTSPNQSFITAGVRNFGLVVNGSNIYWCDGGTADAGTNIMSATLAGGSVTTLIGNAVDPRMPAIDAAHLYWTNYHNGGTSTIAQSALDGVGNIGGATSSTYTLVTADAGHNIDCTITATNNGSAANESNVVGWITAVAAIAPDTYSSTSVNAAQVMVADHIVPDTYSSTSLDAALITAKTQIPLASSVSTALDAAQPTVVATVPLASSVSTALNAAQPTAATQVPLGSSVSTSLDTAQPTVSPQVSGTSTSTSLDAAQPTVLAQVSGTSVSTSLDAAQPTVLAQVSGTSVSSSLDAAQPTVSTQVPLQSSVSSSTDAALVSAQTQIGGSTTTYDSLIVADGPLGFWPLNESSGTTATDVTGNGHNGTYTGGFTLGQAGIGDGETAASFNGSTGYVTVPDASALRLVPPFSIESWVYPSSWGNYPMIVTKAVAISDSFEFRLHAGTGKLAYYGGTDSRTVATVPKSVWSYVVAAYDGINIRLYINGVLSATTPWTGTPAASTDPLRIGARSDGYYFPGKIAKPAVYNYALTPTQIGAHSK